jgi:hypothetical protein
MMRVLEFIVALIIVAIVGVVVGVIMPSSGHVERSMVIGKDMRQVYDVLDNFRRFPDYSQLTGEDPQIKYALSGAAFGAGAEISWTSDAKSVGDGKLSIASATPAFNKVDDTAKTASIVWNLENKWRGNDKHFTLDLERQGRTNKLTKITWSYDVAYGFNLLSRYAGLYIHGEPDAFLQTGLTGLQNTLSSVKNVDYGDLVPSIEQIPPTPVLLVSSSIERKGGLDALDDAINADIKQIQDAAKKLGVKVTGPRILFTTNYGDENFTFDVAMPIDATTLTVAGQSHELTAAKTPELANPATAASAGAPAAAGTAAAPAVDTAASTSPGSLDKLGRLIVDSNVRATLAFGGAVLKGEWNGTFAGVPQTRDQLETYAQTHGYKFDPVVNRSYDILAKPEVKGADDSITSYARYDVYLPLSDAPAKTPEQEAGIQPPQLQTGGQAPASSGSAPAPAGTAAAPAAAASAN